MSRYLDAAITAWISAHTRLRNLFALRDKVGCRIVRTYSAAGHPPPLLWRRRKQQLQAPDTLGLLLGARSGEVFSQSEFSFEAGDRLLVYSDGLTEAENKTDVSFADGKLSVLIAEEQRFPVEQLATSLPEEMLAWPTHDSEPSQSDAIPFFVVNIQMTLQDCFNTADLTSIC